MLLFWSNVSDQKTKRGMYQSVRNPKDLIMSFLLNRSGQVQQVITITLLFCLFLNKIFETKWAIFLLIYKVKFESNQTSSKAEKVIFCAGVEICPKFQGPFGLVVLKKKIRAFNFFRAIFSFYNIFSGIEISQHFQGPFRPLVLKFCRPSPNFEGSWLEGPPYFDSWFCERFIDLAVIIITSLGICRMVFKYIRPSLVKSDEWLWF